jgi:hypothetical protein
MITLPLLRFNFLILHFNVCQISKKKNVFFENVNKNFVTTAPVRNPLVLIHNFLSDIKKIK